MLVKVSTMHNFWIFGLNLTKNLRFYLTFCILPLWKTLSRCSKYFLTLSLGSYLIASSFILMSSALISPYFYVIKVCNSIQSIGVGCSLLNHPLACPFKFSFTILNYFSTFRSRISETIISLSAQSLLSSWFLPQNNPSIPCGLIILQFPILILM